MTFININNEYRNCNRATIKGQSITTSKDIADSSRIDVIDNDSKINIDIIKAITKRTAAAAVSFLDCSYPPTVQGNAIAIASEPKWLGVDPTDDTLLVSQNVDIYGGSPPASTEPETTIAYWSWARDAQWGLTIRLQNTGRILASFTITTGGATWGDPVSGEIADQKDITSFLSCSNGIVSGTFSLQAINTASGDWTFTLG